MAFSPDDILYQREQWSIMLSLAVVVTHTGEGGKAGCSRCRLFLPAQAVGSIMIRVLAVMAFHAAALKEFTDP